MARTPWSELRRELPAEHRAQIDARVQETLLELSLRDMHEAVYLKRSDVAAVFKKTKAELLRHRNDAVLSSLREYLNTLGGELEIWAVLGNKRILVQGVLPKPRGVAVPGRLRGTATEMGDVVSPTGSGREAEKPSTFATGARKRGKKR